DAVMTTPALQRLREQFPDAQITLLTPLKLADLWLHHPSMNHVATFTPKESAWSIGSKMRSGNRFPRAPGEPFDLALVFPNSPRSALEMWVTRIPQRIGYSRPWRNLLLT